MNKYLKNQLYLLYSLNFFRDFNLIFVLLSPFILFSGLTVGDYLITISAFRMTQTFLSIPCGILSDNLNPRRSLQLSSFLFFLSFVFLVPKHLTLFNFIMFNFTSALSATFLLTSSNKHLRSLVSDQEVFLKKYSFKISLRKLGTVISGAIAAVMLSLFSYKGVLYVQLFFGLSVFILSLKFSAPIASSEKSKRVWLFDWKEVWSLMKSTSFFKVLLMAIPFFIATDIMLQTLILKLDLPKWMFPLVIAVSNLLIFVSINQSSKIAKWFPQNLGWSAILSFFPFILYGLFHSAWISLAGMIITILSRSTSVVEMAEFLNELPSSRQGIIESIFSTVLMLIVGGVSLLFGLLLKYYSFLFTNLMIGSLLVITYIVIAIFIARKN